MNDHINNKKKYIEVINTINKSDNKLIYVINKRSK